LRDTRKKPFRGSSTIRRTDGRHPKGWPDVIFGGGSDPGRRKRSIMSAVTAATLTVGGHGRRPSWQAPGGRRLEWGGMTCRNWRSGITVGPSESRRQLLRDLGRPPQVRPNDFPLIAPTSAYVAGEWRLVSSVTRQRRRCGCRRRRFNGRADPNAASAGQLADPGATGGGSPMRGRQRTPHNKKGCGQLSWSSAACRGGDPKSGAVETPGKEVRALLRPPGRGDRGQTERSAELEGPDRGPARCGLAARAAGTTKTHYLCGVVSLPETGNGTTREALGKDLRAGAGIVRHREIHSTVKRPISCGEQHAGASQARTDQRKWIRPFLGRILSWTSSTRCRGPQGLAARNMIGMRRSTSSWWRSRCTGSEFASSARIRNGEATNPHVNPGVLAGRFKRKVAGSSPNSPDDAGRDRDPATAGPRANVSRARCRRGAAGPVCWSCVPPGRQMASMASTSMQITGGSRAMWLSAPRAAARSRGAAQESHRKGARWTVEDLADAAHTERQRAVEGTGVLRKRLWPDSA